MLNRRAVLILLLLPGCGDNLHKPPPVDVTVGNFAVHVELDPARLEIRDWEGRLLIDGVVGGLTVGRAEETFEHKFGAFKIEERARQITTVETIAQVELDGGELSLLLLDAASRPLATMTISDAGEGVLALHIVATDATHDRLGFGFDCSAGEHFLGFGGQSFDADHHGQSIPIWVAEDGIVKVDHDDIDDGLWIIHGRRHSTHTPMPMYLSSRGYALLLETPYRSIFDMCRARADVVHIESWEPGQLRLRLFGGPEPAESLRRMTFHVGRPPALPAFAFAPWLDALYGSANVRRVAQKLRDEGVPASAIWTEDWRGGNDEGGEYVLEEDWELDRDLYPDFEQVAADLHAQGFKWLIYENSFLDSEVGTYAEAVAGGFTIETPEGEPHLFTGVKFHDTSLLDLSNPAARDWAADKFAAGLAAGADGWMADFAEWLPTDAVLASGEPGVAAHNLYPVEWQKLNARVIEETPPAPGADSERIVFVRSGYLGSQPIVQVMWPGDQQTDFSLGDGFPSVIPMAIGLGVTGFPYFGSDIGGYMSQFTVPTTEELWFRWVTLGAMSPVMRTHHGRAAKDNWNWESDAAATAHFKRWAILHIRMYPYFQRLARQAQESGLPLMRPLALAYPEFEPGWTSTDQYMLGDRLIVAPVVTEGATARSVQLPGGTFYPLEGGAAIIGGGAPITVAAPMGEIPVFVLAGTVLVLLPETIQTLAAHEPGVIGLDDVTGARELWLWPAGGMQADQFNWQASGLTGPIATVSWNGTPQPAASTYTVVTGVAPGTDTLIVNGGEATLNVTRGPTPITLTIRIVGL